jgi:predicted ATPase
VLFLVEDAHWIDPTTRELLRDIVLRIHGAPTCVLVTHRPDRPAELAQGLSYVTSLALGRLTNQQIRLLIQSALGPVSDRLVDRIAERADGVPLFVEELTRSILESGTDANENIEIPDSLQGSLMARLDRLSAPSKEVAQIASVIGREFESPGSGFLARGADARRCAATASCRPARGDGAGPRSKPYSSATP